MVEVDPLPRFASRSKGIQQEGQGRKVLPGWPSGHSSLHKPTLPPPEIGGITTAGICGGVANTVGLRLCCQCPPWPAASTGDSEPGEGTQGSDDAQENGVGDVACRGEVPPGERVDAPARCMHALVAVRIRICVSHPSIHAFVPSWSPSTPIFISQFQTCIQHAVLPSFQRLRAITAFVSD